MSETKQETKSIWQKLWDREFTESINMYNVLPITIEELHELMATHPFDKTKKTTIEAILNILIFFLRLFFILSNFLCFDINTHLCTTSSFVSFNFFLRTY